MKTCPGCGAENEAGAPFCASCGDFLDWDSSSGPVVADRRASDLPPAPPPRPPAPTAAPAATAPPPAPTPAPPAPAPSFPAPGGSPSSITPEARVAADEDIARAAAERAAAEQAARAAAEQAAAEEAARAASRAARAEQAARDAADAAVREEAAAAERAARLARLVAPGAPAPKARTEPAAVDPPAPVAPSNGAVFLSDVSRPAPTSPPPTPISEAPSVALPPRRLVPTQLAPTLAAPTAGPVRKGADGSSSLATVITIAERSGRTDLSSRLKASREKLRRTGVTVAVVGEFKKGKSNLVNALVNADVCPSDPVYATVVPIEVGYAEELTITAESAIGDLDAGPVQAFEDPANLTSERGNPGNSRGLSRVTVGLPRRLLATGLTIMDTPGVGGLDSAAGARALASLDAADGVMFVTDCSQELTAPEMTYLQAARERCDSVVCVMTKLDLYQHAPTMRDVNRRHLDAAGLTDVPLVAVSSVLHLLALVEGDQELEEESGFEELFALLHEKIWNPARRRGLADAGLELAEVAAHLTLPMEIEHEAASSPEGAERALLRLAEQADRLRQFRNAAGRWQQRLNEGIQDVLGDLDHDLRNRTRVVSKTADGMADSDDPADDLVFEAWLHKAATEAVIGHYESITARTSALADEIAEVFVAFDRDAGMQVQALAPAELMSAVQVARDPQVDKGGLIRRLVSTTQGFNSGLVLGSSMLGIIGAHIAVMALVPVLTVPTAVYMGRRAFFDDRTRRKAQRSVEMKRLASRYLDEISFIVQKHSRDTIRKTHRQIRDHFVERLELLERTLQQAIQAAEAARAKHAAGLSTSTADHDAEEATVRQLRTTADRLVAVGAMAS